MTNNMSKNEIRTHMKNKRNLLSESQRNAYSGKIQKKLFSLSCFTECDILFTYVSFGSEADTSDIIKTALKLDKRVFVPKVEGKDMNFYEIHSLEGLIRNKFGILEPSGSGQAPYKNEKGRKIMLLPGLAFDRSGNRIGYGAGYYDRYLAGYPENEWLKIGLAFDFQITDDLPVTGMDIRTDYIITDRRLIICK